MVLIISKAINLAIEHIPMIVNVDAFGWDERMKEHKMIDAYLILIKFSELALIGHS